MKKYEADCTYCIPQMCNLYTDREKHPFINHFGKTHIEVNTQTEQQYIELININMRTAAHIYKDLVKYLSNK